MSRSTDGTSWMGPLPAMPGCDCHVCRPDASYTQLDRDVIDAVLRRGWQVVSVATDAGCCHPDHDDVIEDDHGDQGPGFAYTLGLGHRVGHPELMMSGLDHAVMQHALNTVARRVLDGRRLAPGDALEGVLAGVPLAVERVSEVGLAETVIWSGWFHRREPEALALVWPTPGGVFAWQPGAPEALDERQPRKWRLPLGHTGGLAADPTWDFPVPPDHRAFSCAHVVDDGVPILWAARQPGVARGEDWTIHCGAEGHADRDLRAVHLAHLIRSAPSLRQISDLGLDHEAGRVDADSPWETAPIPPAYRTHGPGDTEPFPDRD